ncbi:MAG: hypothetical protein QOI51_1662 [Nocardioidaceae bacterium]|jgi:hypothetical protein|nr:hypothetical protein [Nocardioidaceae bacterium]
MTDDRFDSDRVPEPDEDAELWRDLATMWEARDPMPANLVEHVLVALATEDLDREYELLHLMQRTDRLAGARGTNGTADAVTITFSGESFALLLRVSGTGGGSRRMDGWVTPAREMRVTVKQAARTWEADVDAHGRFEIPQLPGGPTRCWFVAKHSSQPNDEQELFATPTFEL